MRRFNSQLIVASLYSPDGNVDNLSVSLITNGVLISAANSRSTGLPPRPM